MEKSIRLLLMIVGIAYGGKAQKINLVPTKQLRQLPSGWHIFVSEGATFDAEVLNGSLIKGKITWFDTASYSGTFYNNKISGKGTYTWSNGERYEGSFKGNMLHGKGTFYKNDGTKYQGKWKNNKRNGKGKIFDNSGAIVKQGVWEENIYIDKATKK